MDAEFFKWISGLGVGGILAAFIFDAYRKDRAASAARITDLIADWQGQTTLLVQVVRDNTAALTHNTAVCASLHQHMNDGDRRARVRFEKSE